jgi:hypothetical protein
MASTPDDLERQFTLLTAAARHDQLRMRDALAPPGEEPMDGDDGESRPLSKEEALELLALSEVIMRKASYGRQLTVRTARATGASWTQIGAALATSKQSAWETHTRWLAEQEAGLPDAVTGKPDETEGGTDRPGAKSAGTDRPGAEPADAVTEGAA